MLTYADATQLMNKARNGKAKLDHNTYLYQKDAQTLAVQLYATDIILIRPDGTYTLSHGCWPTVTTKDRMNRFSPATVCIRKGVWYAQGKEFTNGMVVT